MPDVETTRLPTAAELHGRNRLALSILSHATPATREEAIDRAVLALEGATITDLTTLAGEMTT